MKPIVIVTQMRSGSNLLGEYLGQLPGALFLGELFKTDKPPSLERVLRKIHLEAGTIAQLEKSREEDRAAFWPELLELFEKHKRRAVAKVFYGAAERSDPLWPALRNATILHLIRENPLASVVSLELADRAGNWQTKEYLADHDAEPVEIRKGKCRSHLERLAGNVEWARNVFGDGDYFELSYDIVARRPKVQRFLSKALGEEIALRRPKHVQQRQRPLAELVSNYADVAALDRNHPLLLDKFRRPFRD